MNILFLGMPASGKGTQGQQYAREHGWRHYSSGDAYRDLLKQGNKKALDVEAVIKAGGLFSDELAIDLLIEGTKEHENCIIDGTPRTVAQARMMEKRGVYVDKAIHFHIPREAAIERMLARKTCLDCHAIYGLNNPAPPTCCGNPTTRREEDSPQNIPTRLQTYKDKTLPVIGHYSSQGNLWVLNANQNPQKVYQDLCKIITP